VKKFIPGTKVYIKGSGTPDTLRAIAVKNERGWTPSPVMNEVYISKDWEGPHIVSALYFLGNIPGSTTAYPDSLVVTFDEGATCGSLASSLSSIFQYKVGDKTETTVLNGATVLNIGQCSDTAGAITILLSPNQVTPILDSMQVKENQLADQYGNLTPANSPTVPVRWGKRYDPIVASSPNPGVPGSDQSRLIVAQVAGDINQTNLPASATVIRVISIEKLRPEQSYMSIYDAVGNLVRGNDITLYPSKDDPSKYYFLWDYTNQNGRLVGTGTYLAIIKFTRLDDSQSIKTEKLGVRR
jgi:hypothetical protein